jgi:glucan phosphorylase
VHGRLRSQRHQQHEIHDERSAGTRDGATIEMAEEASEDNFFLFGLTADQVAGSRGWARKAILNIASSSKFSSDGTIADYAADIWNGSQVSSKPAPREMMMK